jgi:hypothetical protein
MHSPGFATQNRTQAWVGIAVAPARTGSDLSGRDTGSRSVGDTVGEGLAAAAVRKPRIEAPVKARTRADATLLQARKRLDLPHAIVRSLGSFFVLLSGSHLHDLTASGNTGYALSRIMGVEIE